MNITLPESRRSTRAKVRSGLAQARTIDVAIAAAAAMPGNTNAEASQKLNALASAVADLAAYNRRRDEFFAALLRELKDTA